MKKAPQGKKRKSGKAKIKATQAKPPSKKKIIREAASMGGGHSTGVPRDRIAQFGENYYAMDVPKRPERPGKGGLTSDAARKTRVARYLNSLVDNGGVMKARKIKKAHDIKGVK